MTESGFVKAQSDNLPKIDVFMMTSFFTSNPDFTSAEIKGVKALRSGRESYGDSAIGYVQVKREGDICTVKARITPEHNVHQKCYAVTLTCNEADETVLSVQCEDCAAHKGRQVEGYWILGMIQDGSEDLRLEVCPDNVRSAEVLVPLIKKHVAEGTTIHTDYWRAYDCLGDHGYIHRKVNHSDPDNPFVAEDGTHTQRIESQWRVVKRFFSKDNYNNRANMNDLIYEYLWRRDVERNKKDPFEELINVINYSFNK